jgi:hypothetical protein
VSPSPTTARRGWRDSDSAQQGAMIQFSRLALREKTCSNGRATSTSAKRLNCGTVRATQRALPEPRAFDRGQAMPGISGPGIATYQSKKMYYCVVRAQRTGW